VLRVAFAGTPDFAVPALQALLDGPHHVVAVYAQPDRPAGRGRRLRPSPVKAQALAHELSVEQPQSLRTDAAVERLRAYAPDVLIVAAYGLILPTTILEVPRLGALNVHASLLPRWRGAAPIQRAIEAGDTESGVCLMEMAPGLDTGPVVAHAATPLSDTETGGSLHDRLADLGGALLAAKLDDWAAGRLPAVPQPEAGVTYAAKLTSDEAWIDWRASAEQLARRIRAFNPWPIARCGWAGDALRIRFARPAPAMTTAESVTPGTVVAAGDEGLDVMTGEGCLRLTEVQAPGGRAQPVADFLRGHAIHVGDTLT